MTKKRIPVDGISTADEPRQSLFPHMSAQQSIRTGPRSNSIYAGSNDFQKAGRARALSKRISTTVTTTLGADIQALLNEVTNRNEMRSYYSKGTMQVDEDIQTDPVQADFEEQSQMHSNLRDVRRFSL